MEQLRTNGHVDTLLRKWLRTKTQNLFRAMKKVRT